ncbi:MAG TPA: HAMP domain-containing sensor histidine kinase [Chloroflexia bacterium]|nr:HAMP domain-containing sensor histidine kinase [Chloroflexia bacterium]
MAGTERLRHAWWRVPLGLQLGGLYTLLLAATLLALGTALYTQLDSFLVDDTAARLQQEAGALLGRRPLLELSDPNRLPEDTRFPRSFGQPDPRRVAAFLVRALSGPDVTITVLDSGGTVVTATQTLTGDPAPPLPELPADWRTTIAAAGPGPVQWVVRVPGTSRQLLLVHPFTAPAGEGAAPYRFYLVQSASLAAADSVLGQLRLYIALGVLAGTLAGILGGLALTRLVLRPLEHMVATAEAIATGDLSRRVRLPRGRNEVARLGHAFDDMVGRLAAILESQRRFVADASHELRTPLTSLEGLSELLLMGADRGDPGVLQRTVRSIHSELSRLSRLVADLLTLSRLDSAVPAVRARVDAGMVLAAVAEQMAPLATARQVELQLESTPPAPLLVDADQLKQVVLNLVDNALRFTPAGGVVCLRATMDRAAGQVHIQVQDSGPGIPPADLPYIFDRFYRGDASRARITGNSGLGLAIARALVEAHSGTIDAGSSPGQGACFTLTFPVAPAPRARGAA